MLYVPPKHQDIYSTLIHSHFGHGTCEIYISNLFVQNLEFIWNSSGIQNLEFKVILEISFSISENYDKMNKKYLSN